MLTVVLLDVCRLEILWVLDVVEDTAEGGETIGVVCKLCSESCVDDVPRPRWNRLPLPCCSHGCCCCGLAEGPGLDFLVVGHLWGSDYSQLPDPLGFFDSAVLAAADAGGHRGHGLLAVLLLR